MQIEQKSLLKLTPQMISNKFRHLFEEPTSSIHRPELLTPQPVNQRYLFLKRAIAEKLNVTFQLMPLTADGHPVNVTGRISKLANSDRYLIVNRNVNYVVNFDQIRYIANFN